MSHSPFDLSSFRAVLLLLGLALSFSMQGQGRFTVNGRLKIEGSDMEGARVVVYRNGAKEKTLTTDLNRFSLDLAFNANYVLSFEKNGFVSKKLQFDTRLPAGTVARNYAAFEFAVSLFKQYDDVNIVVFNQPVGMIRFEAAKDDFDYDTDYTKSIQSQLQQALAEVEKRQKEEVRAANAEAKRKASEAKLQLKAEAEAKKQAELATRAVEPVVPAPAPVPVVEAAAVPTKPAVKRSVAVPPVRHASGNATKAQPHSDEDHRRRTSPVMEEEASRMAKAIPLQDSDRAMFPEVVAPAVERHEELVIEPNKVMTIVRLEQDGVVNDYRKVIHKWGATFYFKNGESCSQQVYDREAMGQRYADEQLVNVVQTN